MPTTGAARLDVSVIVPCHDRAHTIARALRSIQGQQVVAREIVLVDDGSRDASVAVARSVRGPVPMRIFRQPNQGAAAARNRGLALARGRWVAFLDSDDEWLPEKIADLARRIERDPTLEFHHTDRCNLTPDGRITHPRDIGEAEGSDPLFLLSHLVIKTSTVVVARSLLERLRSWFATDLATCEDYEFFWRAVAEARSVHYTPVALTRVHWGTDGLSRRIDEPARRCDNIDAMTRALAALASPDRRPHRRRLRRQRDREIATLLLECTRALPRALPEALLALSRRVGPAPVLRAVPETLRGALRRHRAGVVQ